MARHSRTHTGRAQHGCVEALPQAAAPDGRRRGTATCCLMPRSGISPNTKPVTDIRPKAECPGATRADAVGVPHREPALSNPMDLGAHAHGRPGADGWLRFLLVSSRVRGGPAAQRPCGSTAR
jgi:hypothetical protein